ncbi:PREDICTED: glucose-6-phosphatase-like, partial [Cariama cristata]|uniref:glucose-6-phosphatase-like n=1 Tax=Cariama cristata TaxID=54380 RepID=UPI0005207238
SPSGHAMGAAGVYYVMVTALLSAAMGKKHLRTLKYCGRGKQGQQLPFRLGCVAASLLVLHLFDAFKPPAHMQLLFYMLSFCKSAAVPLATVGLIPYCVSQLLAMQDKKAV